MTKIIIQFTLLFVLFIQITACDVLKSQDTSSTREFSDQEKAQKFFNSSTISCPSGDCPSYTSGLYSYTSGSSSYSVGSCSSTLIGPNLVLTNEHCLPDGATSVGASCKDRIRIILPATRGYEQEQFECESVVAVSKKYKKTDAPDWAVLKFSGSSSREPVKVNPQGVDLAGDAILFPIYFDLNASGNSRGRAQKVSCKTNSSHFLSSDHIGRLSALFDVSHCSKEIISGNSGTGVLNSKNELIGVYSYGLAQESIDKHNQKYSLELIDNFGGGTNLYCVNYFNKGNDSKCFYSYSGKEYANISHLYNIGLAQQRGENFESAAEEIFKTSQEKNPLIQFSRANVEMREAFEIASNSQRLSAFKASVRDMWVENFFPVLPKCIHKDYGDGKSFSMGVRSLIRNGKKIDKTTHEVSRESYVSWVRFSVERKTNYYEMAATNAPLWSSRFKDLFDISAWSDFKYKVDFCNE